MYISEQYNVALDMIHTYIGNKYEYTYIEFYEDYMYNSYLPPYSCTSFKRYSIRVYKA